MCQVLWTKSWECLEKDLRSLITVPEVLWQGREEFDYVHLSLCHCSFFFFFPLEDSKPKDFVIFFHAIPQSHYLPIIPLSRWHHGLPSTVIELYLWHLTSAVIKISVIFFISSALFLCHFQVVFLLFFCSIARGSKFFGKCFAACSANRIKVLWIFVARYRLHRCFCLEKKNRISNFVEAGTESPKYQDEIRRFLHFVPFPQPFFCL